MKSGNPLTPDETAALDEYSKIMKDLSQTKASIKGNEALMQSKQANVLKDFLKEEKNANFVQVQPIEPVPSFDDKHKFENAMMASLMKDTPEGVFQNAQARMMAENQTTRDNYIRAFEGLKLESDKTFDQLIKNDPDLSHPDNVEDSKRYFSILRDYSPAMAKNPVVLKSFIMKAKSYGGIDPKELTGLIQTNNEYMRHATNI